MRKKSPTIVVGRIMGAIALLLWLYAAATGDAARMDAATHAVAASAFLIAWGLTSD